MIHPATESKAQRVEAALSTVNALVRQLYALRRSRTTNPEGNFDKAGRWYPSEREDQSGDGTRGRSPSRAYPYSYMLRCRTRQHCKVLVQAALRGDAVSPDALWIVAGATA